MSGSSVASRRAGHDAYQLRCCTSGAGFAGSSLGPVLSAAEEVERSIVRQPVFGRWADALVRHFADAEAELLVRKWLATRLWRAHAYRLDLAARGDTPSVPDWAFLDEADRALADASTVPVRLGWAGFRGLLRDALRGVRALARLAGTALAAARWRTRPRRQAIYALENQPAPRTGGRQRDAALSYDFMVDGRRILAKDIVVFRSCRDEPAVLEDARAKGYRMSHPSEWTLTVAQTLRFLAGALRTLAEIALASRPAGLWRTLDHLRATVGFLVEELVWVRCAAAWDVRAHLTQFSDATDWPHIVRTLVCRRVGARHVHLPWAHAFNNNPWMSYACYTDFLSGSDAMRQRIQPACSPRMQWAPVGILTNDELAWTDEELGAPAVVEAVHCLAARGPLVGVFTMDWEPACDRAIRQVFALAEWYAAEHPEASFILKFKQAQPPEAQPRLAALRRRLGDRLTVVPTPEGLTCSPSLILKHAALILTTNEGSIFPEAFTAGRRVLVTPYPGKNLLDDRVHETFVVRDAELGAVTVGVFDGAHPPLGGLRPDDLDPFRDQRARERVVDHLVSLRDGTAASRHAEDALAVPAGRGVGGSG